ncbi:MAG: FtsX-like permease family protein, partial [Gemmatimonadota bacterium]
PLDMEHHRRALFIGNELRDKLFGDQEAVGRTVYVDGRPFTVVGALRKKIQTSNYSGPDADRAYIPLSTFIAIWGNWSVQNTLLVPAREGDAEPMKQAVYEYLGQKYRFDPTDKGALMMWDTVEFDKYINWFFWGLKALMGLGGALTLGAGGIGVANIMFLIVRERTREIGVRLAVGARTWHILGQILLEAILVVAIGGVLGFLVSAGLIAIAASVTLPEWIAAPRLSPAVAAATIAILSLVGVAAGYFPARRAAGLDPVRALEF